MKPVVVSTDIDCPPSLAWEYMANAEHNTEWLANMRSCRWITGPPVRLGSRYEQIAVFLGKEVRTSFEVTSLEDERLITITSLPGSSFPLVITREVAPDGERRCRVTETAGGDSSGFYALAEPLMRPLVRRNIVRAYRRLKQLLEAKARQHAV
jgi:Polyketide cyclase / dehydrase and lipid transport